MIVVAILITAAVGATEEATPSTCNRNASEADSLEFEVPSGTSVWQRIPSLGISPELETITEPVTVVVFEGPHHAVPIFPALRAGSYSIPPFVVDNVVCIVAPSGEEMYYSDVDLAGLNLEGLALDRSSK